jgi:prophage maintenance system killer protein
MFEEDLIEINKRFADGKIINKGSLSFALSVKKTEIEQIAYLIRALLIDHSFEDGNKRTATSLISIYFTEYEIGFDPQKLTQNVIKIASKNINNIPKIKRMIKNVIR